MIAHHILKTRNVAETPQHKQLSKVQRQQSDRVRSQTAPDVNCVQESPMKLDGTGNAQQPSNKMCLWVRGVRCGTLWTYIPDENTRYLSIVKFAFPLHFVSPREGIPVSKLRTCDHHGYEILNVKTIL